MKEPSIASEESTCVPRSKLKGVLSEERRECDVNLLLQLSHLSERKEHFSEDDVKELKYIAKLVAIFRDVDKDSSGFIDKDEIIFAMKNLGYHITFRQGEMMLKRVDEDKSGEISLEEFVTFFQDKSLDSLNSLAQHWAEGVISDIGADLSPSLPPSGLEIWQTVVAGGCGGVASRTLTAPLEKVKLAAQTGRTHAHGMFSELSYILRSQGFRGLFAGNLMNCARVFPTAGIACTCYLNFLSFTPADAEVDPMEPVYRLVCGGAAAFIANTITYPMDIIRVRMTVSEKKMKSLSALQDIYSKGGVTNFYRGLKPTHFAVVPFIAFQNASIDFMRDYAIGKGIQVNSLLLAAVGGGAGIVAQTFVYPLDVLRRRMQLTNSSSHQANKEVLSDQMWIAARQIVRAEGFRSLFAGILPTYIKTVPAIAVVSTVTGGLNMFFKAQNRGS